MSKLTTSAMLLATALLLSQSLGIYAGQGPWTFASENPYTVSFVDNQNLYTVSHSKNYYKINEQDKYKDETKEICNITVDPVKEVITGRLKAAALFGKIVVWGKRNEELVGNDAIRRTNYTVLLIDPMYCTHYIFTNLTDEVPNSYPDILPEVMVHQDSFDVFFPSQKICSPCSFHINGGQLPPAGQLKHKGLPKDQFYLREVGITNTYAYLYNFDNGKAELRLLGRSFNDVGTNLYFGSTVTKLTTNNYQSGYKTYIGVTYILPWSPRLPALVVLTPQLEIVYSVILPILDYYDFVDVSFVINERGASFVTLTQESDKSKKITGMMYTGEGRLSSKREIGELELHEDYEIQSFYDNWDYCVVIHKLSHQQNTNITCFR